MKYLKEKQIERAIRLIWSSLESHLTYTYEKPTRVDLSRGETQKFHKDCIREYAETIKILSELM